MAMTADLNRRVHVALGPPDAPPMVVVEPAISAARLG
jgi:hypothetical protein